MTHFSARQNQNSSYKIYNCAKLTKMPNDAFLCTFYTKIYKSNLASSGPFGGLQLLKVPRKIKISLIDVQ